MGFMDELRKLTQPYDDEDDFYEGAEGGLREPAPPSAAQMEFESTFAAEDSGARPEPAPKPKTARPQSEGGLFGGLGRKPAKPKPQRERTVNFNGSDQQVILFNPKTFDEAGDLVNYLGSGRPVVMTLEGLPLETARRLLDFLSGITFALEGKITPISSKTYFVTPQNVDVLGTSFGQEASGADGRTP